MPQSNSERVLQTELRFYNAIKAETEKLSRQIIEKLCGGAQIEPGELTARITDGKLEIIECSEEKARSSS